MQEILKKVYMLVKGQKSFDHGTHSELSLICKIKLPSHLELNIVSHYFEWQLTCGVLPVSCSLPTCKTQFK